MLGAVEMVLYTVSTKNRRGTLSNTLRLQLRNQVDHVLPLVVGAQLGTQFEIAFLKEMGKTSGKPGFVYGILLEYFHTI